MKTKFTLLWLILIVVLTSLGNSVYASSDHPSHGHKTSFRSTTNPPAANPPFAQPKSKAYAIQVPLPGEHIRIGTYNFQFWPSGYEDVLPGFPNLCCDNIGDRERKVAERILASGYDIIAFNEVWDEDAKDKLVDYLGEQYPYFVKYVEDADETIEFHQDSGLMLFSRFPFELLPHDTYKVTNQDSVKFYAQYEGQSWDEVAFIEYNDCSGDDCLANKGAGYVRIRNPQTGRIYNVVFTHLNAGDSETRRLQLQDVERLITSTMFPEQIASEDIFFLGDMNINGNHAKCRTEWDQNFGDGTPIDPACEASEMLNPFFHNVLHDSWEYEMQPGMASPFRDPSLTGGIHNGDLGRSRLDYILRSWPPPTGNGQLCMQHMTVAYNLRFDEPYVESGMGEAGNQEGSDHYGLNADLNLQAPYCSPASARVDLPFDQWSDGQITYPGSMQWFYFASPGTYSISVRSDGPVDFHVYKSTDLSSPIERRGEATGRWTFNFPKGQFYIRVFARDRAWSGAYQLMVHQHAGGSPSDAIVLFANQPMFQHFGETTWFWFPTEAPDSGQAQNLRMFVDSVSPAGTLTMDLFAADATTLIASSSSGAPEILRSDIADNNQTMFLRVRRSQAGDYRVGWTTNLTVLHGTLAYPLKMRCDEQTEFGIDEDDDDVKFSLYTEGDAEANRRIDHVLLVENWDEGRVRNLGDVFPAARFTQELVVEVNEWDGFLNDNDILQATIPPLPAEPLLEGQPRTIPATVVLYDVDGADYNGEYRFYYNLSHGLEFGFPSDPLLVDAGPDQESPEGELVVLSETSFIDFRIAAAYTATIDWGDRSPIETGTVEAVTGGGNLHFDSHIYQDNGIYTVNICVTADGLRTACASTIVNVSNVAPTAKIDLSAATLINGIPTFFAHAGMPIEFTGYSTDPGRDDLVLCWDWGDGSPISEIFDPVNPPEPIIQSLGVKNLQTHTFELVYVYTIKFWATDDDGGVSPVDTAVVIVTGNARQSRPTGYWQDQFGPQGQTNFDEPTLMRYLAINDYLSGVYDEVRDASTIASAYDVLSIQQNQGDAREQFDSELLTVWLNFANGAIEYHELIRTAGNNNPDATFAEVVAHAEAVRLNSTATEAEIRRQKNILHNINH